jgi:hypothetical protein
VRINVAFWNLGNLFDTVDDPISDDFDFTPAKGWTTATQETKVANLAKVVDDMFGGSGPDLLGVCEVENEATLQQLVDAVTVRQDLEIFTFQDASDIRGIDCALIYSNQIFQPITLGGSEPVAPASHIVHNRYPTRDIFEAPLRVVSNNAELIVYINHWPSRSQGRYLSEPLRIAAANHLGRLIDRRLKFTRQELLAMPDTNVSMITVQNRWNRKNLLAIPICQVWFLTLSCRLRSSTACGRSWQCPTGVRIILAAASRRSIYWINSSSRGGSTSANPV